MHTAHQLREALPRLSVKDQEFANSLLNGFARFGGFTDRQQPWVDKLVERALNPQPARPAAVQVGDLSGIIALFDKARKHLKFPAIVLGCAGLDDDLRVSVYRSGARAGQLKVCLADTYDEGKFGEQRRWLGSIDLDGVFTPSFRCDPRVAPRLAQFAADPAKVAGEHGRLTGNCCFCRKPLTDERSTAVGYGKTCSEHYQLPWGHAETVLKNTEAA